MRRLNLYQVNSILKTLENDFGKKSHEYRALVRRTAKRRVLRTATATNSLFPVVARKIQQRLRQAQDITFLKFRIADLYYSQEHPGLYEFHLSERRDILMSEVLWKQIKGDLILKLKQFLMEKQGHDKLPEHLQEHLRLGVPVCEFVPYNDEMHNTLKNVILEIIMENAMATPAIRNEIFPYESLFMDILIGVAAAGSFNAEDDASFSSNAESSICPRNASVPLAVHNHIIT